MIDSAFVSGDDAPVLNEMRVLGGLMELPDAFLLLDWDVEFFDDTLNRQVLGEVLLLAEANKPFDRLTVGALFASRGQVELARRVYECWVDRAFTLHDLAFWHALVKKLWAERVIRLTGAGLVDNPDKYQEALEVLQSLDAGVASYVATVGEYFDEYLLKRKAGDEVVSAGDEHLDRLLNGGWRPGVYGVAGRMKQGKTLVLLWMARLLAQSGKRVLFVSYEMTKPQIMDRLVAGLTGLDSSLLAQNKLDFEVERDGKFCWARDLVDGVSLPEFFVLEAPVDRTVGDLRNLIVKTSQKLGGLDAVFVDYAQIMTYTGKYANQAELNLNLSKQLQALSSRFALPVVSGLQLKRPDGVSERRIPDVNDIGESDQYGKDMSGIFYLIRSRVGDEPEWAVGKELILKLGTHRFGPTASARYLVDDATASLTHQAWR